MDKYNIDILNIKSDEIYWDHDKTDDIYSISKGFLLKHNLKNYLILTNHSSDNLGKNYIIVSDKQIYEITCNKKSFPIIDIIVYEILDDYIIDNYEFFNSSNNKIHLKNQFTIKNNKIEKINLTESNYNILFDKMPMIVGELITDIDLNGLSGSIVNDKSNIIGILSGGIDKYILIVPLPMILSYIDFHFNIELCEPIKISRFNKLKEGDTILEYDFLRVSNNTIFDDKINEDVPLSFYTKMYKMNCQYIDTKILRNDKIKDIKLKGSNCNTIEPILITKNDQVLSNLNYILINILEKHNPRLFDKFREFIEHKNFHSYFFILKSMNYNILIDNEIMYIKNKKYKKLHTF